MIRVSRLVALALVFAASIAAFTAPPARSGCVVTCDPDRVCPSRQPAGIDSCTGRLVCGVCLS